MAFIIDPVGAGKATGGGEAAAAGEAIKDGDTDSFVTDVIEASSQVPVIVDFWAPWCGPCKQLGPLIEKLVRQAGGLVRLVKINVDENQKLAAEMRVQSIPAVYAFKGGRPVDAFVGAQPESQIRGFVDRLLGDAKPPLEQALERAAESLDHGDHETASAIYAEVLANEPGHAAAAAGMLRCAIAKGDIARARQMAAEIPPEMRTDSDVAAAISAIELAEQGSASEADMAELKSRLAGNRADHQARFDLAMAHYGAGETEAAVEELLELVRGDQAWNDDAARKQLVKIFGALGNSHPLTVSGRRRLSSILFS